MASGVEWKTDRGRRDVVTGMIWLGDMSRGPLGPPAACTREPVNFRSLPWLNKDSSKRVRRYSPRLLFCNVRLTRDKQCQFESYTYDWAIREQPADSNPLQSKGAKSQRQRQRQRLADNDSESILIKDYHLLLFLIITERYPFTLYK